MKASFKFRKEEEKPLFRAKVPLNILGFPFQSEIAAGDSKELSLNLTTFFESGPSVKISYLPNDSSNPFSLIVKTGIGHYGSPVSSPMTMSAEFNLLDRGNPRFFLNFRPQVGDFSIKKTLSSSIALSSPSSVFAPKIQSHAKDLDSGAEASVDGSKSPLENSVYQQENGSLIGERINGSSPETRTAGAIGNLLAGVNVSAETALPVRDRAVVKFRWGVKLPAQLRSVCTNDGIRNPMAEISLRKIPFLEISKISIEHLSDEDIKETKMVGPVDANLAESCVTIRRQLEVVQAENRLLRKAMEEIRSEICTGKLIRSSGILDSGKNRENGRSRKSDSEVSEFGGVNGKMTNGDVNEELKKALMEATSAGN